MTLDRSPHTELISRSVNVADARLGAVALSCSDDFFAPMARMLNPGEPEWRAGVYDAHGKWMDGWESRRRRNQGYDHCVVRLAGPCTLALFDIDTRFFTGNFPPFASVEACRLPPGADPVPATEWTEILPAAALVGDAHNYFPLDSVEAWTHVKLNIYPDGGVARLRAYGTLRREWTAVAETVDLAAALNGARALACSDEHYGSMHNILLPGRGSSMADGWETRRRREPGYDWVILRLGQPGRIQNAEFDTAHFKGNFPHQVSVNAALIRGAADADLRSQSLYWPLLLEPQNLQADSVAEFRAQVRDLGVVSHVRVNLHPDGGLSRVRLFGNPGV